jgi:hypothetical protein
MKKHLKVLVVCPPSGNPYVSELVRYLNYEEFVSCTQSNRELFESGKLEYDVVHIQWPEAIFGWNTVVTASDIDVLENRMSHCKKMGIKIILTVHNEMPHFQGANVYSDVYKIVYSNADAFIHLGQKSIDILKCTLGNSISGSHFIIPHGNYGYFNEANMGCMPELSNTSRFRILCFGAVRKQAEIAVICQVADILSSIGGELVVAGRIYSGSKRTLNYYRMRIPLHRRQNVRLIKGKVPDESVASLISSCDALLIPRVDTLNSGNVALGFTFGKVVLGPNIGVIGEELTKLGNPTFDPSNYSSLKRAVENLVDFVDSPLGSRNKIYAETEMDWIKIARLHKEVYLSNHDI